MAAVFTLGSVIGGLGQTFDMVVVGRVLCRWRPVLFSRW